MVLRDEFLVVVEIPMVFGTVTCRRDEEAEEEKDDDESKEEGCVFGGSNEPACPCTALLLKLNLIVLFVPEVGEGNDEQAQQCIEAV